MTAKRNFDCLLPETRTLLENLIETAPFLRHYTFVGGSALALHLCHRKSEDLDFFTYEQGKFNKNEIHLVIKQFEHKEILNESDTQIDLLINGVKITFFDAAWHFLRPEVIETFNLASLNAIAAMKVNVLFVRAKYRDYYDLYFLAHEMSLRQMFAVAKEVVNGINYKLLCVALLYIDDIADDNIHHLEPKEQISTRQIQVFFEKLMK